MKKIEKILTTWFIVFTTALFVLERVWAQVITSPVSLYLYFTNGIAMIAIWVICKIVNKRRNKEE